VWEPRRLTTLWTFTACYSDNFTFLPYLPELNSVDFIRIWVDFHLLCTRFLKEPVRLLEANVLENELNGSMNCIRIRYLEIYRW
jgi:hypothetical protein